LVRQIGRLPKYRHQGEWERHDKLPRTCRSDRQTRRRPIRGVSLSPLQNGTGKNTEDHQSERADHKRQLKFGLASFALNEKQAHHKTTNDLKYVSNQHAWVSAMLGVRYVVKNNQPLKARSIINTRMARALGFICCPGCMSQDNTQRIPTPLGRLSRRGLVVAISQGLKKRRWTKKHSALTGWIKERITPAANSMASNGASSYRKRLKNDCQEDKPGHEPTALGSGRLVCKIPAWSSAPIGS